MYYWDILGAKVSYLTTMLIGGAFYGVAIFGHSWYALIYAMFFFVIAGYSAYVLEIDSAYD